MRSEVNPDERATPDPVPDEPFTVVCSHRSGPQKRVFVAEQPPRLRATDWWMHGYSVTRVLSFPRIAIFVPFYRGVPEAPFIFYLPGRFHGYETRVCHSTLPNTFESGRVCLGDESTVAHLMTRTARAETWESRMALVIGHFWSTHFGQHMLERLTERAPKLHPHFASLAAWERASRKDPNFVNQVEWEPAGTVRDVIRRAFR